jgi:hypothetical protein
MKPFVLVALVLASLLTVVTLLPAQNPVDAGAPAFAGPIPPVGDGSPSPVVQADTIRIRIIADADSVIADPNSVTVRPGQVVTWICDLGDWTVRFQDAQPFGEGAVSQGISGNRGQGRGQAVRANARQDRYKYDIMVRVQGGPPLTADPEIVVGPEGDGGGR